MEETPRRQRRPGHFLRDPEHFLLITKEEDSETVSGDSLVQKQRAGQAEPSFNGTDGGGMDGIEWISMNRAHALIFYPPKVNSIPA